MKRLRTLLLATGAAFLLLTITYCTPVEQNGKAAAAAQARTGSPADHLPPYIKVMTYFGERADWSLDGKKILFREKTFGQAFTVDVGTSTIRPVTLNYFNPGYTRALYLSNGDILLSGARQFDPRNPWPSRTKNAELWVLKKDLKGPPVALGTKCVEGPAASRKHLKIAWTLNHETNPQDLPAGASQIWMADIRYDNGVPGLVNKKLVLDSRKLPFKAELETQNFRPPDEKELTFSAYGYQGTDVMGINLDTGKIVNYSKSPTYEEPEGIFPDGEYTCVESNQQVGKGGSRNIDIYKLRLDGSARFKRLTYFNDYPGYKASNPFVSDDGRYMAFQMAKVGDPAGVGRGIFVFDFSKAPAGGR
jgi:Tol biopolymer transport system component